GFLQIQIAFVVESLGEDLENAPQHTRAHPLLKPPVARLLGGIPVREIGPWGAGPRIHKMPLSTARFSRHGRPRPSVGRASLGREGPIRTHWSSVRSRK